jgi:hypothetical protein
MEIMRVTGHNDQCTCSECSSPNQTVIASPGIEPIPPEELAAMQRLGLDDPAWQALGAPPPRAHDLIGGEICGVEFHAGVSVLVVRRRTGDGLRVWKVELAGDGTPTVQP